MFEAILNMLVSGWLLNAQASQTPQPLVELAQSYPQAPTIIPTFAPQTSDIAPVVSARSALVVDQNSRTMLYDDNIDEVRSIASITKLMTALIVLDHQPAWQESLTLVASDMRPGAASEIGPGESATIRDLFTVMLVASSNESAVALARSTGLSGDEFVAAMNAKAVALGMKNTTFVDMTGLNGGNRSTARDLAILGQTAFSQVDVAQAVGHNDYSFTVTSLGKTIERRVKTTNLILGDRFGDNQPEATVEAGKTGFIESAGYCILSQVRGALGQHLTVVVLGSDTLNDRFVDTKNLASWALSSYRW